MPVLAAAGEKSGIGAESALRLVSILSFGAIVVLGWLLIRRVVADRRLALAATALLAVSTTLFTISKMAWSEPPFVALTLVFLLVLAGVWERRVLTRSDVAVLVGLCWTAFLLRYAGMVLIAFAGLALLLALRPLHRRAFGQIVGFVAVAAIVPIGWMLRNRATDGTLLGPRQPSPDSFVDVGRATMATFGEWVLPVSGVATSHLALLGTGAALLVGMGVATSLRTGGPAAAAGDASAENARTDLCCWVLFVVVYVGYLMTSTLITAISLPNPRYLSPVYVPAVALAAVALTVAGRSMGSLAASRAPSCSWPSSPVRPRSRSETPVMMRSTGSRWVPTTRSTPLWLPRPSGLVEETADPVVYSNDPNSLWAATQMQPIQFAPVDQGVRNLPLAGGSHVFEHQVGCTTGTSLLVMYLVGDPRASWTSRRSGR